MHKKHPDGSTGYQMIPSRMINGSTEGKAQKLKQINQEIKRACKYTKNQQIKDICIEINRPRGNC